MSKYKIFCQVCKKEITKEQPKVTVKINKNGYISLAGYKKTGKFAHEDCMEYP